MSFLSSTVFLVVACLSTRGHYQSCVLGVGEGKGMDMSIVTVITLHYRGKSLTPLDTGRFICLGVYFIPTFCRKKVCFGPVLYKITHKMVIFEKKKFASDIKKKKTFVSDQ